MANTIENIYIVNAPAGSGKTTKIKSLVKKHTIEMPDDNILCITYTNRAADELKKDFDSTKIHISTIHSFLNSFLGIYYSHSEILSLYFEVYSTKIEERIRNDEQKTSTESSNQKYIDKHGSLSLETVRQNIDSIFYNETSFNSLYYGGLSHDDLITFSCLIFQRFSLITKRLTHKFQAIFIDEYQDTSASVLKLFYNSVHTTNTKLYFLGDKMQQIYNNYDGTFESELNRLNTSISLRTNHRSIPKIIHILNKLYNDENYNQVPSDMNVDIVPDYNPRIIVSNNLAQTLNAERQSNPDALCLYLLNQKKFDSIGASNLYRSYNRLDRYSFTRKYSATDVLTDYTDENIDIILHLLYLISKISDFYVSNNLGKVINILKSNPKVFNPDFYSFVRHEDKTRIKTALDSFMQVYNNNSNENSIMNLIDKLNENGFINENYLDEAIIEEYSTVLAVNINEFHSLLNYINDPNVSTQHGVKGESHDSVFFIAEDSSRTPIVHMYKFFELYAKIDISLTSFESFYYEFSQWITDTEAHLGVKIKDITPNLHSDNETYLVSRVNDLLTHFEGNSYFNFLCRDVHESYIENPNKTRLLKCFKQSSVHGTLNAYRLFYVGCSRARKNLTIFLDQQKITSFQDDLLTKLNDIGFSTSS